MNVVKIHTEYINLGQFLKYVGVINNGGEAKQWLLYNKISYNYTQKEITKQPLLIPYEINLNSAEIEFAERNLTYLKKMILHYH